MANLEPRADKVVRDAVDAFMDGRIVPDFGGETVFETKNSRYRLIDGVVFSAPDISLVGAELVGWLWESAGRFLVEATWRSGARAVLVDRARGRSIVVTSTTRLLGADAAGAAPPAPRGPAPRLTPQRVFESWRPPPPMERPPRAQPTPLPPFSPHRAPIIASTPPPATAAPEEPDTRDSGPPTPRREPIFVAAALPAAPAFLADADLDSRDSGPPTPPTVPRMAAPFASAAHVSRAGSGVHAPPRPIGARPPAPSRPLPAATLPPRHPSLPNVPAPAPTPPAWQAPSADVDLDADTVEPSTEKWAEVDAARHEALRQLRDELEDDADPDPVNSLPFPLVRFTPTPDASPPQTTDAPPPGRTPRPSTR